MLTTKDNFNYYHLFKDRFCQALPSLCPYARRYKKFIKFLISGLIAAGFSLVLLWFFHGVLGLHLLISTNAALILSFLVSFSLQKFWTFKDKSRKRIYHQFFLCMLVGVLDLLLNSPAMHYLVNVQEVWYLLSQIIVNIFLAIINYILYRFLIFRKKK